jgi:hypothetical protein
MRINFFSAAAAKFLELKQKIEIRKFHLLTFYGSWYSYYPFELSYFEGFIGSCEDDIYYPFSIYISIPFFRENTYYLEDYHDYNHRIIERLEHMEYDD